MPTLDHLLIPARDRCAAAERLAAILDVPWSAQAAVGPFSAVYVSDNLTVDFDEVAPGADVPLQHYAFRVSDAELVRWFRFDFTGEPVYGKTLPHPAPRQLAPDAA